MLLNLKSNQRLSIIATFVVPVGTTPTTNVMLNWECISISCYLQQ